MERQLSSHYHYHFEVMICRIISDIIIPEEQYHTPSPGMKWGSQFIVILTNFGGLCLCVGQDNSNPVGIFSTGVQDSEDIMLGDDHEKSEVVDNFYDYYGLDYDEDENVGLGELLNDIGPELLQTVSPTLIVGIL